jgi:hypothetical protein
MREYMDYVPRRCRICDSATSELRNGREHLFPCTCDWAGEFWHRVREVVYKNFITKNMGHWSPKIFHVENSRNFKRFIKIQKALAIQRIYEFAFMPTDAGDHSQVSAITRSIANNRNLFIRGPRGSGRGLITASIKFYAAAKKISSTVLPGTFDVFKDDMTQAKQFGVIGADARILVSHKYENVSLLALEGVKGESSKNYKNEIILKKHPASDAIDRTLAMRAGKPGSLLISGPDFVQEIGDTAGDRLYEMLLSDKTSMVLMFSPLEADALLTALTQRRDYFNKWVKTICETKWDENPKMQEQKHLDEQAAILEQALYFVKAFPEIPNLIDKTGVAHTPHSIHTKLKAFHSSMPQKLSEAYVGFNAAFEAKDFTYTEGIKEAQKAVVRECKVLAMKMSDREIEETGAMISLATAPSSEVAKIIEQARILRDKMAGKSDDI